MPDRRNQTSGDTMDLLLLRFLRRTRTMATLTPSICLQYPHLCTVLGYDIVHVYHFFDD